METLKIKSSNPETQGDFVIINAEDFDPQNQVLFETQPDSVAEKPKKDKLNG